MRSYLFFGEGIEQKSCFIIASNQLDESQFSHEEILDHYTPGQQKVERGFRFLKDPWFMANTLFLKLPKRIMGADDDYDTLSFSLQRPKIPNPTGP